MERLKQMKEVLMNSVQSQLGNLDCVDAKELGEAVDMIKDFSEAIYYCTITKEMEENKEEKKFMEKMGRQQQMPQQIYQRHYTNYDYDRPYYRDIDRDYGRMYYDSNGNGGYNGSQGGGNRGYTKPDYYLTMQTFPQYPHEIRDVREGRSPMNRRSYMESKEMHKGKEVEMQELERYMQELSTDITEMIQNASPEEKQMLQQKLTILASKMK